MQSPTDASQGKIKVRLEILPEKQSFENRALAQTIANGIFERFDQASGCSIEPHYTGEMSGATEFLILIASNVAFIGGTFVQPFIAKLTEKTTDKAADKAIDLIFKKFRRREYSELESDATVQSLADTGDITLTVELKTGTEATISIKVSRDHP